MSGNVVPGVGDATCAATRTPLACGAALAIAVAASGGGSVAAVLPHPPSASSDKAAKRGPRRGKAKRTPRA